MEGCVRKMKQNVNECSKGQSDNKNGGLGSAKIILNIEIFEQKVKFHFLIKYTN